MVTATTNFRVETPPPQTIEKPKPRIDQLTVTPETIRPGQPFKVSYRITNDGSARITGKGKITFTCPGACMTPKTTPRVTLEPKQSKVEDATFVMPPTAKAGTYSTTVTYEFVPSGPEITQLRPRPSPVKVIERHVARR